MEKVVWQTHDDQMLKVNMGPNKFKLKCLRVSEETLGPATWDDLTMHWHGIKFKIFGI
jgi:hypothetical protein